MEKSLGSNYRLHEVLGRGAMGQVFTGTVRPDGRPVAIKVLKPELVSDPEVVARFVQERSILMSVDDPHVVRVTDLVVEGETLAIVMELIAGPDLRRYLHERGPLPPAEAVHLTGQLLHGLAAVHAAGIIHRDVKPENLLLGRSASGPLLKLTDFGVARLSYGASLTKLSGLIGTPEYMAPELAEHDSASPATDVYSAGIVLYELLCGRTPFAGGHPLAVLRRQVDQAPAPIPGVPEPLWGQIAWMLAKDPRSRPGSAAEAAAGLSALQPPLAGRPAPQPTVLRHRDRGAAMATGEARPPGSGRVPRRSRPARLAAVVAVAMLLVAGLAATVVQVASHRLPPAHRAAASAAATTPAAKPIVKLSSPSPAPSATPPASATPAFTAPMAEPPTAEPTAEPPAAEPPAAEPAASAPVAAAPPSAAPPSAAPAAGQLSSGEQQLEGMLNGGVLAYCASAPAEEGGAVAAAINCDYVTAGPTKHPLVESLVAGSAQTWFNNLTGGFVNGGNCAAGQYLGSWNHHGTVGGLLGCGFVDGLLRIVWVIDGQVGVIAEGSVPTTLDAWFANYGCLVPAVCSA